MNLWVAIFDWDGVIVDSAMQHERSWELLVAEEKGRSLPPDHFRRSFGMKNEQIIPELFGWTQDPAEIRRLSLRKEELYRQIIQKDGLTALPGAVEWLRRLKQAGISCAIGSSTHRENIRCCLQVLGIEGSFEQIVSSEDVKRGKPDPEVFLLAAKKLGAEPSQCVVFEDAHVGIEAARAAGMNVVGVATTHPANSLDGADRVVQRLDELTVSEVVSWLTPP